MGPPLARPRRKSTRRPLFAKIEAPEAPKFDAAPWAARARGAAAALTAPQHAELSLPRLLDSLAARLPAAVRQVLPLASPVDRGHLNSVEDFFRYTEEEGAAGCAAALPPAMLSRACASPRREQVLQLVSLRDGRRQASAFSRSWTETATGG